MTCGITVITFCLVLLGVCSGLVLERLPRHIPAHKDRFPKDSTEDEDVSPTFDTSVEKRKILQDPSQMAPLVLKPTWKAIYPFPQESHVFHNHKKRRAEHDGMKEEENEISEKDRHELVDILKDEEQEDKDVKNSDGKKNKDKKDSSENKHTKTKRQSNIEMEKLPDITALAESVETEQEESAPKPDFQEWLRREYYRNMAKNFATMRRKRDGSSHEESEHSKSRPLSRREKRSKRSVNFEEVTDNLRAIEDVLFLDALETIKEAGDDYEEDVQKQRRITNDLSSAYDLETMRNALFRLRDTLGNMEQESMQEEEMYRPAKKRDALQTIKETGDGYKEDLQKQRKLTNDLSSAYDLETVQNALFRLRDTLGNMDQEWRPDDDLYRPSKKRGEQCPPLELLTSDCTSLGDIVPEGPMKRLLQHACNWHEVCYTCGEVFGLSSETCDVGFVEQSQTICRGDVPCESTASLLLLPLRQRRVFYKRSNPNVCLVDTCVEDFLKQV